MINEDLRDWFGKSKSKGGKPGWVQSDGSPCANEKEDKGKTPKCFSSKRLASLKAQGKKGEAKINSAVRRKRSEDKGQQKKSGGAKPTMVRTFKDTDDYDKHPSGDNHESFNPMKESSPIVARVLDRHFATEDLEYFEEENKPTNPKLWAQAKAKARAKFDVYPSAYANGYASKWYKSKGGGWKSVKEEVEVIEEKKNCGCGKDPCVTHGEKMKKECPKCMGEGCRHCNNTGYYTEEVTEAVRMPSQNGNVYLVGFTWRGKYMMMKIFFPEIKRPAREEVEKALDGIYPGSRVMRYEITPFQPGETLLHVEEHEKSSKSCSKGEYYCNDSKKCKSIPKGYHVMPNGDLMKDEDHDEGEGGDMSEGAAWTKKSGKNSSGGLNEKGRKSYEKENPGSDLKAPSKKVGNKRRTSFCARMKGMRKRQKPSNNTGDDRLSKSLRAWNC
tara:strand:+ start:39672 stop:41000 length:1329 start_codon:yes stop_codon:yes gene_type:complete